MRINITFKLSDAALICKLAEEDVLFFLENDWLIPHDPINFIFDEADIDRIILISELKESLGVNDEGVPIILHLIDQLNHIHSIVDQ